MTTRVGLGVADLRATHQGLTGVAQVKVDPAPAAPAPTPPPAPTPSPSNGFYVWGGTDHSVYLGFFTCVFCTELASDSINNKLGSHGNAFGPASVRNGFGTYGDSFDKFSACNEFATYPPGVYNSNRSIYYGELTLNQFRADAISEVVNWLQQDVCKH
jgi:hypothetical protein